MWGTLLVFFAEKDLQWKVLCMKWFDGFGESGPVKWGHEQNVLLLLPISMTMGLSLIFFFFFSKTLLDLVTFNVRNEK